MTETSDQATEQRHPLEPDHDPQGSARTLVRHFASDFDTLERAYPGTYPRMIVRGEGAYLWDDTGHKTLDAGVHLGACQIGHGRQEVAAAVAAQLQRLEFVGLEAGFSHEPVAVLATRLRQLVPLDDPRFSFCASGSEANDLAFKIARAYHRTRGEAGRYKIVSRINSYHGAGFGGLSATGHPAFREPFEPTLPGFRKISHPSPGRCGFCELGEACSLRCADDLERVILQEGSSSVAAFIAEPVSIFQAVKVPHPDYWRRVREICDAYEVLLIADEVVTGFGRTGRLFGIQHWGVVPDLLTMAKGLTSGYVPMGATAVAGRIHEALNDSPFMHINTYAGHPGASAAALAALDILTAERLVENAASLESTLRTSLDAIAATSPRVVRITAIGLLGCVEFQPADPNGDLAVQLRHELYQRGVAARVGVGDGLAAVLFYPPLLVDSDAVISGVAAIGDTLAAARVI